MAIEECINECLKTAKDPVVPAEPDDCFHVCIDGGGDCGCPSCNCGGGGGGGNVNDILTDTPDYLNIQSDSAGNYTLSVTGLPEFGDYRAALVYYVPESFSLIWNTQNSIRFPIGSYKIIEPGTKVIYEHTITSPLTLQFTEHNLIVYEPANDRITISPDPYADAIIIGHMHITNGINTVDIYGLSTYYQGIEPDGNSVIRVRDAEFMQNDVLNTNNPIRKIMFYPSSYPLNFDGALEPLDPNGNSLFYGYAVWLNNINIQYFLMHERRDLDTGEPLGEVDINIFRTSNDINDVVSNSWIPGDTKKRLDCLEQYAELDPETNTSAIAWGTSGTDVTITLSADTYKITTANEKYVRNDIEIPETTVTWIEGNYICVTLDEDGNFSSITSEVPPISRDDDKFIIGKFKKYGQYEGVWIYNNRFIPNIPNYSYNRSTAFLIGTPSIFAVNWSSSTQFSIVAGNVQFFESDTGIVNTINLSSNHTFSAGTVIGYNADGVLQDFPAASVPLDFHVIGTMHIINGINTVTILGARTWGYNDTNTAAVIVVGTLPIVSNVIAQGNQRKLFLTAAGGLYALNVAGTEFVQLDVGALA